jgi:hypothetical protein
MPDIPDILNNKLTQLNLKESNYVIFRPYKKKLNFQNSIKMFNNNTNKLTKIECKLFIKYLGILIDSIALHAWKYHIDNIASKISKSIGIITRLRHFVPLSTLLSIYQCLILPYITYGMIVWGQASNVYLNKILNILQKRALRLINLIKNNKEHAILLFSNLNILPFLLLFPPMYRF